MARKVKRVTKKADRVPISAEEIKAAQETAGQFEELNAVEIRRKRGVLEADIRADNAKKVQQAPDKHHIVEKRKELREGEYLQSCGAFNDNVRRTHIPEEIRNSYENYERIKWQFTRWRKSKRAQDVDERKGQGPILLIASGPSLNNVLPILHKWNGAIICTASHATSCVHAGKDPTYIVSLDHRQRPEKFNCNWWYGRDSALITHPAINPEFNKRWKGKTYFYRKMVPDVNLHAVIIPLAYGQWIKTQLAVFSSSTPAMLGLAEIMGYSPIILVGCDFGLDYFRKWSYEKRADWMPRAWPFGHWVQAPHKKLDTEQMKSMMIAENGVKTNKIQVYYKRSMICGWRLDKSQVIHAVWGLNRGEKKTSILEEFPQGDAEETIEAQGTNLEDLYLTVEEIKEVADKFLMRQRTYPIPIGPEEEGAGIFFQEFNNWHKGLPKMAASLNAQGAKIDVVGLTARFERLEAENKREHPGEGK